MRASASLVIIGFSILLSLASLGESSTDEICTDICNAAESCGCERSGAPSFCHHYDKDQCMEDCKEEGDWTWSDYDGVSSNQDCDDMNNRCGF